MWVYTFDMLLPQGSPEKTIRKGGFRFLHKRQVHLPHLFKIIRV